jgi:predicted DsbA family dithiol-disulfide isomerase
MTGAPTLTPPAPGVLQLWSDLLCPFAHVALVGLRAARAGFGPGDPRRDVQIEHRIFALELFNGPHSRRGTDTEAVGLGQIAPDAGFRIWTAADDLYPHTVLLAAEAVLAASGQSLSAGEGLDAALRAAFWTGSRSIAHGAVILDVAAGVAGVDVARLQRDLEQGTFRAAIHDDHAIAQTDAVAGSPTFVLPGGDTVNNPGITVHWQGDWAVGFPVVDAYDPSVYADLLTRSAKP